MEKNHNLTAMIDELLNLSVDWTPLEDIWERICFQFGKFEKKTFEDIARDLKELGVLETRNE